ncbi:MAG: DUF4424 domain-containing protein [Elusimicrobiota bacterium]|jgi:hypothetical protein|nr:DUF4424 domain-containing protein [Elusimicrobiota bacterium]
MKNIVALILMLLVSISASADTTSGEILPNGDVEFIKQENIDFLQESLFLSPELIEANYFFKNNSDEDITTTMIFPVPKYYGDHNFDFKLWVNGKRVKYNSHFKITSSNGVDITEEFAPFFQDYYSVLDKTQKQNAYETLSKEKKEKIEFCLPPDNYYMNYSLCYKTKTDCDKEYHGGFSSCSIGYDIKPSFYWEQTFPKGEIVHIRHSYIPSVESAWESYLKEFEYVLNTAKNWGMPLKQFNLIARYAASAAMYDSSYTKKEFKNSITKDGYFSADIKDFIPEGDIAVRARSTEIIDWKFNNTSNEYIDDNLIAHINRITPYIEYTAFINRITPVLYKVSDPEANFRDKPNGKKIGILENNAYCWAAAKKGNWFYVIQGDQMGWTHKMNLKDVWPN